jgi:DNA-binding HxlR family transcriptional regulator
MKTAHNAAACKQHLRAFNDTLDILNGKWIVLIIGHLASGKKRYLELQRAVEGIGPKMLSKELQSLELNGLVKRSVLNTKPITVEYELTPYGASLKPIIDAMADWGQQHRERVMKEIIEQ